MTSFDFMLALKGGFGMEGPRGGVGKTGKTVSNINTNLSYHHSAPSVRARSLLSAEVYSTC